MKILKGIEVRETFAIIVALLAWLALPPSVMNAQCTGTTGSNAVYASCGIQGSASYVDASASASTSVDICATIYGILQSAPAAGVVIDARGISSHNSNLTCAASSSPWYQSGTYLNKPSVVLLPAQTITFSYTWVLPNMTRVLGEGASNTGSTGTILSAGSAFSGLGVTGIPTAMIQFGDTNRTGAFTCSAGVCFNISLEDVTLNGGGQNIDGILNLDSEELTYVKNVSLYQIAGTGLQVGDSTYPNQSQNSGPYSNIYYSGSSSGTCAQIYGAPTRGIHGISCVASSSNPGGAILLDSPSNDLEDVYIENFKDGILVGSQITGTLWSASGNVLLNISGANSAINLIHICNPGTHIGNCPGTGALNNVTDISVVGATAAAGGTSVNTIEDDMSVTTLPVSSDAHVAMYALGEAMGAGYSRFSTSKSFPTWYVGSFDIGGSICTQKGSLYSSTALSSANGLYVCVGSTWVGVN